MKKNKSIINEQTYFDMERSPIGNCYYFWPSPIEQSQSLFKTPVVKSLEELLKDKHDIFDLNKLLVDAAHRNNHKEISILIMHGANDYIGLLSVLKQNKKNAEFLINLLGFNDEILDIASRFNYFYFFEVALEKGLDPNYAILFACRNPNNLNIVEYLINNGAWDLNPALYFASLTIYNSDIIDLLLNRGAWDVHFAIYGVYRLYADTTTFSPSLLFASIGSGLNLIEYQPPNDFFEYLIGSTDLSTRFLIEKLEEAKKAKEAKEEENYYIILSKSSW